MVCPKCKNNYCKIVTVGKTSGTDYSIMRGILGEACFGSDGFMFGFSNSRKKDVKAYWVCNRCGYKFKA